jgi:hypothetical protein
LPGLKGDSPDPRTNRDSNLYSLRERRRARRARRLDFGESNLEEGTSMTGSPTDYLKLGLHLEFLRGMNSFSARTQNDIGQFPYLLDNQAPLRFTAPRIIPVVKSLLQLLERLRLTKSLEIAGQFRPMIAEVEAFIANNPNPESVTLHDHFAEKMIGIAEEVLAEVRKEIA